MRRVFNTDPTDTTRVVEAIYDDGELVESVTHNSTKDPDDHLFDWEAAPSPEPEQLSVEKPRTDWVKWAALSIAIFEVVRDAIW